MARRTPKPLETLLREYFARMGNPAEMRRGLVLHLWKEVVGRQVAEATRDLRFENDRLIVTVINEAWRHELHMNRFPLRKRLNERVGSQTVKEILVRC